MKISIIIPALNEQDALPKLLTSLTNQTHIPDEIIIVDGKSDDRTLEFANRFRDQFPSFQIIQSTKRNLPYQRNLGGKRASGDWLVFVDADTTFPTSFFATIYHIIEQTTVDAFTVFCLPDDASLQARVHAHLWNMSLILQNISRSVVLMGSFAAMRTSIFTRSHGYDETYSFAEDMEYSFRLKKENYTIAAISTLHAYLSQRRFRRFGYIQTVLLYAYPWIYMLFTGRVPSSHPTFQMGGHVFSKT